MEKKNLKDNSIFLKNKEEKKIIEEYYFLKKSFLKDKKNSEKEIEQIKKITTKDIENSYNYSFDKIIKSILVVIDNLERALSLSKKNEETIICTGLKNILKTFSKFLLKFNIRIIDSKNNKFNPNKHQAIAIVNSIEIKNNYIVEVIQKGYTINNRLLRPAMVIVSNNTND